MRASHLFGTLELPGQKAYPSKDNEYGIFNPSQGIFEVKDALVRKKTSTGRLWNEYGDNLPIDKVDIYPKREYGSAFPLSKPTGSLFTDKKASNPEMITGFGFLPEYPEDGRIKDMLEGVNRRQERAEAKEFFGGIRMDEVKGLPAEFGVGIESQKIITSTFDETNLQKYRTKYDDKTIDKLKRLGFTDETIGQAIRKEAEKDLAMVLENPGMFKEAEIASAIQSAYENYMLNKRAKTGENAGGIGAGGDTQNPGVRAYAAPAQLAENPVPVKSNTGISRLARELGQEARAENINPYASTVSNVAAAGGGGGASVGTGPGGKASFEETVLASMKKGGGRPLGSIETEETKAKRREKTEKTKMEKALTQAAKRGYEIRKEREYDSE
jgi:hypothetical protein